MYLLTYLILNNRPNLRKCSECILLIFYKYLQDKIRNENYSIPCKFRKIYIKTNFNKIFALLLKMSHHIKSIHMWTWVSTHSTSDPSSATLYMGKHERIRFGKIQTACIRTKVTQWRRCKRMRRAADLTDGRVAEIRHQLLLHPAHFILVRSTWDDYQEQRQRKLFQLLAWSGTFWITFWYIY